MAAPTRASRLLRFLALRSFGRWRRNGRTAWLGAAVGLLGLRVLRALLSERAETETLRLHAGDAYEIRVVRPPRDRRR